MVNVGILEDTKPKSLGAGLTAGRTPNASFIDPRDIELQAKGFIPDKTMLPTIYESFQ